MDGAGDKPIALKLTELLREHFCDIPEIARSGRHHAKTDATVSIAGVGALTAITMLTKMPERGQLDNKQVASLAGLAPQARDSGQHRGHRHIRGGAPSSGRHSTCQPSSPPGSTPT